MEYYTTYPKTTEKTGATRFPKGTPNSVTCTNILYYYHSKKKNAGEISTCTRDHFRDFRSEPLSVTSLPVRTGDATSSCACAVVRFSGSSTNTTLSIPIYY